MIKNYVRITLRNLFNNPLYAFINILSLAVGLAVCIILFLFVQDERSFDRFHTRRANIYRLDEFQTFEGSKPQKVALSMPSMGPALQVDFPEVTMYTRYYPSGERLYQRDGKSLLIESSARVDSTFLEIFSFPLLAGDPHTALDEPNSILLTEETALHFFEDATEAVGNTITEGNQLYKITGVLKNVPVHSHLQFNALISLNTITSRNPKFNNRWGSNYLNTYLVLEEGASVPELTSKFDDFMVRHMGEDATKEYSLFLQSLSSIHLASTDIEHDYVNYRKFDGQYLDMFMVVGVFILLIASVNFMNLSTARASYRWKEIGVRKAIGAQKYQLFKQFVLESVLLAMGALLCALVIDLCCIAWVNDLLGLRLSFGLFWQQPVWGLVLVGVTVLLGIAAGFYPSLYMAAFNTVRVLKGNQQAASRSVFRSSLLVVQFGLAVALIVSTLIVLQQLNFMRNKDVGFTIEQMMLVDIKDMSDEANHNFYVLKHELEACPYVLGVTGAAQRLGANFDQQDFKVKTDSGMHTITPSNLSVDYDYLEVYGIKLKEGRSFSKDYRSEDGRAFIVNEALVKALGLSHPLGTPAGHEWYPDDSLGTIIGVVEDFNFNSLHHKVDPLAIVVHPFWGHHEVTLKLKAQEGHMADAVAAVKAIYEQHVQNWPFQYSFLDEHFDNVYRVDQQMGQMVASMAVLAILIASMGLFGLAAIITKRKVKEIGVRKVLGAPVSHITYILSKDFMRLIVLASLLFSPVTYFLLEHWLQHFAFRISINPFVFISGGVLALLIAMATIGFHVVRAALENPVKALKTE